MTKYKNFHKSRDFHFRFISFFIFVVFTRYRNFAASNFKFYKIMERKNVKVKGSALITAENEVFFTPYRKLPPEDAKWKILAAAPCGIIRKTDKVLQIRLTYSATEINKSKIVDDFIHLLYKVK